MKFGRLIMARSGLDVGKLVPRHSDYDGMN
jgi:hypothetical protein